MFEQSFDTSPTPHITVEECAVDLTVRAVAGNCVTLHTDGEAEDVSVQRQGEHFILSLRDSSLLICPPATTLTIKAVHGDLHVHGVTAPVAIGVVDDDLNLHDVGPVAVERVAGDLSARRVDGDMRITALDGDLRVTALRGGLESGRVGGDIRLEATFPPGTTCRLRCAGDLRLCLPEDASLRLAVRARGEVRSRHPALALDRARREFEGVLGAGEATLEAQVDGNVYILAAEPESGEIGEIIETSIAAAMAELESRLTASLGRYGTVPVSGHLHHAAERARREMERAAEQARREAERARMQAERAERRWQRVTGQRPSARRPVISDEERLRVLRLVEEGKISPTEAADLLDALEGR
jgi:hypothetical protein